MLPTSYISFILQVNSPQGDWLIHAAFAGSFTFSLTSPGTRQVFFFRRARVSAAKRQGCFLLFFFPCSLGWFVFNLVVRHVTVPLISCGLALFFFIFVYLSVYFFFFSSAVICHPGAFVCHLAVTWPPTMLDWHGSLPTVTELRSSCPESLG